MFFCVPTSVCSCSILEKFINDLKQCCISNITNNCSKIEIPFQRLRHNSCSMNEVILWIVEKLIEESHWKICFPVTIISSNENRFFLSFSNWFLKKIDQKTNEKCWKKIGPKISGNSVKLIYYYQNSIYHVILT